MAEGPTANQIYIAIIIALSLFIVFFELDLSSVNTTADVLSRNNGPRQMRRPIKNGGNVAHSTTWIARKDSNWGSGGNNKDGGYASSQYQWSSDGSEWEWSGSEGYPTSTPPTSTMEEITSDTNYMQTSVIETAATETELYDASVGTTYEYFYSASDGEKSFDEEPDSYYELPKWIQVLTNIIKQYYASTTYSESLPWVSECGFFYEDYGPAEYQKDFNILTHFNLPDYAMPMCTPVQKIHFVKTFKTGGSTVAEVLFRYFDQHDMTSILIPRDHVELKFDGCSPPELTKRGTTQIPPFDFLINHAPYHSFFSETFLPGARRVTILRDPIARFVETFAENHAGWKMFGVDKVLGLQEAIHWILKPENRGVLGKWGKPTNNQVKYFSYVPAGACPGGCDDCPNTLEEAKIILRNEFDLVMITELFDESMVLLQQMMCWNVSDVLYLRDRDTTTFDPPGEWLTDDEKEFLHELLAEDIELYEYGVGLLEQKLAAMPVCGSSCGNIEVCIDDHLQFYRAARKNVFQLCKHRHKIVDQTVKTFCDKLLWDTTDYTRHIAKKLQDQPIVKQLDKPDRLAIIDWEKNGWTPESYDE